jgi:lipopolysaccharide export system ATP-binding protein
MAADIPEQPENGYGLIVDQVSFKRGGRIFGPLSIRVRGGQIIGLLGPNGAGKTSLLRVIEGVSKPSAGVIRACGSDITALSRSGRQNIGLFVCLHDSRRFRANRSMLELVAGAVSRNPKVLLLDEPFNSSEGLLPKQAMLAVLKACRDAGTAILLTDHDIRYALQIVDRAYLLFEGKIMAEGNPDELLGQPDA